MDQPKRTFPSDISVYPQCTSDANSSPMLATAQQNHHASFYMIQQLNTQPLSLADNRECSDIPTMQSTLLDCSAASCQTQDFVQVAPSMTAVDNMLKSLHDQDQASSDLEVQSVMCPETRNLLPTLKSVCASRSSSSSKSSKSSYSPLRLQVSMTNAKRGNVQSVTPTCLYNLTVHQLAAQGEIATLEEKFREESEIDEPDASGRTPLMWACANQQTDIVQYLLASGADVAKESFDGETALAFASCVGCVDIVRKLLTEGADVNKTDWNEGTPLLYAVFNNHPICVRLLLEAGADLTVHTEGGYTPLGLSVALGHREVQLAIETHMISLLQNR